MANKTPAQQQHYDNRLKWTEDLLWEFIGDFRLVEPNELVRKFAERLIENED